MRALQSSILHRNNQMNSLSALSLSACQSSKETTTWYCPVHLLSLVTRHMGQLDGLNVKLVHLLDGQSPRCVKTVRFWILVTSRSFDSVSHFDAASRSARSTIRTSAVSYTITCSDIKKHHSLLLDMSCRASEDLRKYWTSQTELGVASVRRHRDCDWISRRIPSSRWLFSVFMRIVRLGPYITTVM